MKKLEDFILLEKIFKDVGITPNWFKALSKGETKLYEDNTMILNWYIDNNVCIVNSGSVGDKKFTKSMLRDIKNIIVSHNNVIISSSVLSIEKYLSKYGFIYNKEKSYYIKGLEAWV